MKRELLNKSWLLLVMGLIYNPVSGMDIKLQENLKEIQFVDLNSKLRPADQGKLIGDKEYLDLTKDEPLLLRKFKELIEDKVKKGEVFILAVVTMKEQAYNPLSTQMVYRHNYYGANGFNRFIFNDFDDSGYYKLNRFNKPGQGKRYFQFKDPLVKLTIIHEIKYFTIDGKVVDGRVVIDTKFTFLGTDWDLFHDPNRKEFLHDFFKANQDLDKREKAESQIGVGEIFEKMGDLDKAKKYYQFAANQNDNKEAKADAQVNLGIMFEKEKNVAEAKKYYQFAANQNDEKARKAEAQMYLAIILDKEGELEEAKKLYFAASMQEHDLLVMKYSALLGEGLKRREKKNWVDAKQLYTLLIKQVQEDEFYKRIIPSIQSILDELNRKSGPPTKRFKKD